MENLQATASGRADRHSVLSALPPVPPALPELITTFVEKLCNYVEAEVRTRLASIPAPVVASAVVAAPALTAPPVVASAVADAPALTAPPVVAAPASASAAPMLAAVASTAHASSVPAPVMTADAPAVASAAPAAKLIFPAASTEFDQVTEEQETSSETSSDTEEETEEETEEDEETDEATEEDEEDEDQDETYSKKKESKKGGKAGSRGVKRTASEASFSKPKPVKKNSRGEDMWAVEKIAGRTSVRGKVYYLVRWIGFPREDDTWEPASYILRMVPDLVKNFEDAPKARCSSRLRGVPPTPR